MNTLYCSTFPTPAGEFSLAVDSEGAVVATTFGPASRLSRTGPPQPDERRTAAARGQVQDYFGGRRNTFDLSLSPEGTPFQKRVWKRLLEIPCGETVSYGEIARGLGSSARAVGRAVGSNPICLIVPCHRVIGSDGSLTGFAFGTRLKQLLLDHESGSRALL